MDKPSTYGPRILCSRTLRFCLLLQNIESKLDIISNTKTTYHMLIIFDIPKINSQRHERCINKLGRILLLAVWVITFEYIDLFCMESSYKCSWKLLFQQVNCVFLFLIVVLKPYQFQRKSMRVSIRYVYLQTGLDFYSLVINWFDNLGTSLETCLLYKWLFTLVVKCAFSIVKKYARVLNTQ